MQPIAKYAIIFAMKTKEFIMPVSSPSANPPSLVRQGRVPRKAAGPARHRRAKALSFGDLCEMSGGVAAVWRRKGCTEREMLEFMDDEPFVLCDIIPMLHGLGFTEDDVLRYVPHDGVLAHIALQLAWLATGCSSHRASALAVPPWLLASFLRKTLTRRIATMKNRASRQIHYEAEKTRRRAMAAERRRVSRRMTVNPCPSRESLLDAWRCARDTKESLVRFGSMMQDLECYVDNSLRFDGSGRIVGRNAGIKGWLRENVPEMAEHYTSVMRYKAAAKKLRQIVGLSDPTPVVAVLGEEGASCDYGAEKSNRVDAGTVETVEHSPPLAVVRARAIYLEAMDGVPDVAARVMARIDELCDPERTDEAAMLRGWREKCENEITMRRKSAWWRRLRGRREVG